MDKDDSFVVSKIDCRWVQENFFKEAKVKEDIDHNFGYQFEDSFDEEVLNHMVKNPNYVALQKSKHKLQKRLEQLLKLKGAILSAFEKLKIKKTLEKFLLQKKNKEII